MSKGFWRGFRRFRNYALGGVVGGLAMDAKNNRKPNAPATPSPDELANKQWGSHMFADRYNTAKAGGGVTGPDGMGVSMDTTQKMVKDASGKMVPVDVQSTKYNLGKSGQSIWDRSSMLADKAGMNLQKYADGPSMMDTAFNTGDMQTAIEDKLAGLGRRRLAADWAARRRGTTEANQARGITSNSALGDRAARRLAATEADDKAALATAAYGTAAGITANERAQRMQALQADRTFNQNLLGGAVGTRSNLLSQLYGMPDRSYKRGIQPVDVAGLHMDTYKQRMDKYKADLAKHYGLGEFVGDVAGTAGSVAGAYFGAR